MKCFASLRRTLLKVFVEHLFPTRRVNVGRVRYHTIEVKKYGIVPLPSDHASALGQLHRTLSCYQRTSITESSTALNRAWSPQRREGQQHQRAG
jgi:hypothetical protein